MSAIVRFYRDLIDFASKTNHNSNGHLILILRCWEGLSVGLETDRKMTVLDLKMRQNTCLVRMNTVLWREILIRSQLRIRIEYALKKYVFRFFLLILHFDEVGV